MPLQPNMNYASLVVVIGAIFLVGVCLLLIGHLISPAAGFPWSEFCTDLGMVLVH